MSEMLEHLAGYIRLQADVSFDPQETYMQALDSLVKDLLADGHRSGAVSFSGDKPDCVRMPDMASLNPEDVGSLYERLRGFRLRVRQSREPELVPCVRGKRNQGLFYTPSTIVTFIVERTLDCLRISDPTEYLNLKILDPAVGTGVFLAEALEQITERVRTAKDNDRIDAAIASVKRKVGDKIENQRLELDRDTLIRIHVVEKCLYGVDLDPTAVEIARAVLLSRVQTNRLTYAASTNILHGNALKGEVVQRHMLTAKTDLDRAHASAFSQASGLDKHCFFHWPEEFPEVFSGSNSGFDAVIGNPPYEILSVKESGLQSRRGEQIYFRNFYSTCTGKINTYRLMIERALQLLRKGGALGFIVPATLLGDSTAEKLRRMILEQTSMFQTVVIPEKAKVFPGVTQALLVMVTRKSGSTDRIEPIFWNGDGPIHTSSEVSVSGDVVRNAGFRVPLIRTRAEMELLQAVTRFPPLGGNNDFQRVGRIHQGEINLTVHRDFITDERTMYPLIRGEHVNPLRVNHPVPGEKRLDWVLPDYVKQNGESNKRAGSNSSRSRSKAWKTERIVLARVVNMDTERRLKAAFVGPGVFLGDMTNFLAEPKLPVNYLLGLLNSRLLNWRMRLTSTNNYISAAEIQALPIPRIQQGELQSGALVHARQVFNGWTTEPDSSVEKFVKEISGMVKSVEDGSSQALTGKMIEWVAEDIQEPRDSSSIGTLWNLLDSLVLILYGVESMQQVPMVLI
ncbi:MAG: N-6 DNA methylase [Desulfomonile tiedjei]|uniref:site-specific DNA-methyltransferase (adenine-specific) n=1 Tax=Desulfomonile tiedjei TaxID=2358 RepID=A0A9D6V5P5_9BACT|nr:N-6 DNA methylase [Desulfomonile tiedjei]